MDLYFVLGNKGIAPRIAHEAGWLYGVRYDCKPYAPPQIIDAGWEPETWEATAKMVQQYRPYAALTNDFMSPADLPMVLQQVQQLREWGVSQVMVCPKFANAIECLPEDITIAISIPSSYAGFLPARYEVAGRRLHLLGGNPEQWAYCLHELYSNADVISADGNTGHKAAIYSRYFAEQGFVTDKTLLGLAEREYEYTLRTLINTRHYLKRGRYAWSQGVLQYQYLKTGYITQCQLF